MAPRGIGESRGALRQPQLCHPFRVHIYIYRNGISGKEKEQGEWEDRTGQH